MYLILLQYQVSQTSALTVECAAPLLKLWINILLKVLSVQEQNSYNLKDSAKQVHFLLDVIIRISSMDSYTRNSMIDFLFSFANVSIGNIFIEKVNYLLGYCSSW